MRNASGVPHGKVTTVNGGYDGGGYVGALDISDDGWMLECNDTTVGAIRGPNDTAWRELFIAGAGGNIASADITFKNPAGRTYDACFAPSNSNIVFAGHHGYLWKSTNRASTWTKLTGYKAGVMDINVSAYANGNSRFSARIRVSPTNPLNVGFIHPVDGLYYSTNGGTGWTLSSSVPAPTGNVGGNIHFVSDTEVWVVSCGNVARRSTTGVGGTFAVVTGGPTVAAQIASGGGKVYFVGDTTQNDTQLYVWNGTVFSQPSGIIAQAVAVRPTDTTKVILFQTGGGMRVSTDTGATWSASTGWIWKIQADDCPYLGKINANYFSVGCIRWHPTNDQLIATNGIGVFTLASPVTATSATKMVSITKGVRQMLPHEVNISPNGTALVPVEDRVGGVFTRANVKQQTSLVVPDAIGTIRHGGPMDYARDNENYIAVVYAFGSVGATSSDAGKSWTIFPTIPTFTSYDSNLGISYPNTPFFGGEVAVSNVGNILWVSTSNDGVGSAGGVKYTTDGGTTWLSPVFGASVSTAGAAWHHAYYLRRRITQAFKGTAGVFYLFCNGTGIGDAADIAMTGMWKSINGGANFTKIRAGHFTTFSTDFYQSKHKLNQLNAGHAVWVQGATNNYPTPPSAGGIYYTNDDWANTYTDGAFSGWSESDDFTFGAPAPGAAYQSMYCYGWRGGVYGLWGCFDFNPTTRAGTWGLQEEWANGKTDTDMTIAADLSLFGRVVAGISSGGIAVGDYVDVASGT